MYVVIFRKVDLGACVEGGGQVGRWACVRSMPFPSPVLCRVVCARHCSPGVRKKPIMRLLRADFLYLRCDVRSTACDVRSSAPHVLPQYRVDILVRACKQLQAEKAEIQHL